MTSPNAGCIALLSCLLLSLAFPPAISSAPGGLPFEGVLAYVKGGDVWILQAPAGETFRVTTDGRSSSPRLSPSTRWVAFRRDKTQVWIARADGSSAEPIGSGARIGHFTWAPDRDRLAFLVGEQAEPGELWLVEPGSKPVPLVTPISPESAVREMVWSSGGQSLLYLNEEQKPAKADEWPWEFSIKKIRAEGGDPIELLRVPPPDDEGHPGQVALPEGVGLTPYTLFWQCETMSASIMADGCPLHMLLHGGIRRQLSGAMLLYSDFLALSPDQRCLALTEGSARETWSNKRICTVELESGEKKWITGPDEAAFSPAWSPDGEHLAFVSAPDGGSLDDHEQRAAGALKRRIWVAKRDGSEKYRLTQDDAYRDERPMWTGDGRHILFARLNQHDQASLWAAPIEGGAPHPVVDGLEPHGSSFEGFDYFGHREWSEYFDWQPGANSHPLRIVLVGCGTLAALFSLLFLLRNRRMRAIGSIRAGTAHARDRASQEVVRK